MIKDYSNPNQVPDHTYMKRGGQKGGGRSDKDLGLIESSTIGKEDYTNPKPTDIVGQPVCPEKTLEERRRGDTFKWK